MNKTNFLVCYWVIFLFLTACNTSLDSTIVAPPKGKTSSASTLSFSKVLIKNNYLSFALAISKIHFRSINFYIFLEDSNGQAIELAGANLSCAKLKYKDAFLDCAKHSLLYKLTLSSGEHKTAVSLKLKRDYLQSNFSLKVVSFSPFVSNINHKNILKGRQVNFVNSSLVSAPDRLNVLENYLDLAVPVKLNTKGEFAIRYQVRAITGQTQYLLEDNDSAATTHQDFTPNQGSFVLNADNNLYNIKLNIVDDNIYEGSQSFVLTLTSNQPVFDNSYTKQILITIDDDEEVPFLNIKLFTASEKNQTQYWPVSLSWPSETAVAFDYQLHSTWTDNADNASDYLASTGSMYFSPLQIKRFIPVNIIADTIAEGDEQFSLSVSNLQGLQVKTNKAYTSVIKDSSKNAAPLVQFATPTINARAGRRIRVPVEIRGLLTTPIKVYYRSVSDGTAVSAVDFEDKAGVLLFKASTKTYQVQHISINILNGEQTNTTKNFSIYIEKVHNGKIDTYKKTTINIL